MERRATKRVSTARGSLWAQPGSFWLGAFKVAEAPVALVMALLEEGQRAQLMDLLLSGPFALVCAVLATLASGLAVAWLGHHLGLGE